MNVDRQDAVNEQSNQNQFRATKLVAQSPPSVSVEMYSPPMALTIPFYACHHAPCNRPLLNSGAIVLMILLLSASVARPPALAHFNPHFCGTQQL